ncbi:fatty acid desaturase [Bradyrhizobium sp. dw_411]|uniref:acyl-CoA desaturase n=1 Tax=Bradyrhizobium sp. dw_411 TaxID=2720082 RepID=UPI001BD11BAB|nr:fatty acid desaturase [Bradyrhizobium sp. dw_411]
MNEIGQASAGPDVATCRARPLSIPIGACQRQINWRYASAVGTYHLLALLALLPWFFSRTGVALAIAGVFVFGSGGINLCYHRLLSHRSFSCPLWLEHALAMLAVCCVQDTPARWVATHRLHHHRADDQADPHSPLVNLFWSYTGWLFLENTDLCRGVAYDRYARDIVRDKFYRWIERAVVWITLGQSLVYFAAGFLIELLFGGTLSAAAQFGASIWLWGVVIRTILVWHITWCGNSFPHLFGYRNYETDDNSRNNMLVAIITNGEGWHNNHHADPNSASNQHRWWEFDLTYLFLRLLVLLGLAWDVQLPKVLAPQRSPDAGLKR